MAVGDLYRRGFLVGRSPVEASQSSIPLFLSFGSDVSGVELTVEMSVSFALLV